MGYSQDDIYLEALLKRQKEKQGLIENEWKG